mgnify:CR=1 FL=1
MSEQKYMVKGARVPCSLPPEQHVTCEQCGHDRALHHSANLSDGPFVGKYLLICPTAVFKHKDFDVDGLPFTQRGSR